MMKKQSIQIPTFLPRNFNTSSATPVKLVSSFIALVRPLDSPQSPSWMVLCAEPSKGVTQLFNPFTRTPVQSVDLTKFHTTILATECHIVDNENGFGLFCSGNSFYIKALMLSPSVSESIENCHLFATFDDGRVCESHPFDGRHSYFQKVLSQNSYHVDDIINYKGKIYALDKRDALLVRQNRYKYCGDCSKEIHFCERVVETDYDIRDYAGRIRRRKRLVVSPSGDTLYKVDPCISDRRKQPSRAIQLYFKVYELDSNTKSWIRVSSFDNGDVKQVMFATRDYCFFVAASEFPEYQLRNCIIFSDDAFPRYEGDQWNYQPKGCSTTEVAVFPLDKNLSYSMPVKTFPGFPATLWSPPPWILHNASSDSSQSGAEKDGMAQSSSDSKQDDVLSTVDQSDSLANLSQPLVNEVVILKKFQGIDVLPCYVPVLENVWMKHGDVLKGIAMCSNDTKSMALTSLAKILLILETTNNGNILTKDQAQYLGSTFNDLQYMHLKLDWLAPSVKKALATYKHERLMELDKGKGKAQKAEMKFLSELDNYINGNRRSHFLVRFSIAVSTRLRNMLNRTDYRPL